MKSLNILLADDMLSVGLFVSEYLKGSGHSVCYVQSGEEAVAEFRKQNFDLVLMDVVMPGIGGLEAVRQIKAIQTTVWVPIIIVTAQGTEDDILSGFLAGADDYILKPLKPVTLDIRIRSMMRIAAMQRNTAVVVDSVIEGIVQIDRVGRIQRFNIAAQKMFGYTETEVLGKNVNMLMPSPYHEQHDEYISNYIQTRTPKVIGIGRQVMGLRKNGESFPLRLNVTEAASPDGKFFVGLIHDLSYEVQVRAQLDAKSADLEAFFDASIDLLAIADSRGRLRTLNPAWQRVLGYALADLDGVGIFDFVHPDDSERAKAALSDIQNGLRITSLCNRVRTRGGDYKDIDWHVIPYDTGFVYIVARDMTRDRVNR